MQYLRSGPYLPPPYLLTQYTHRYCTVVRTAAVQQAFRNLLSSFRPIHLERGRPRAVAKKQNKSKAGANAAERKKKEGGNYPGTQAYEKVIPMVLPRGRRWPIHTVLLLRTLYIVTQYILVSRITIGEQVFNSHMKCCCCCYLS